MKKAIENIGKKVIDFLYDFDNNEYALTKGGYEPENCCYEPDNLSINIHLDYAGHEITGLVEYGSNKIVEVLFESDNYENIQEAVNEYVERELDLKDLIYEAIEDRKSYEMDEYQRNGFADEADYNRYRYGSYPYFKTA